MGRLPAGAPHARGRQRAALTSAWQPLARAQELFCGDSVRVKMSENPVPTINKRELTSDWFDSLDRCFKWSDRLEQKPLPAKDGEEEEEEDGGYSSEEESGGLNGRAA